MGRFSESEKAETHRLISREFVCDPRGRIAVKGRGDMPTYLLVERIAEEAST